jgi:hypothetical protein
MQSVRLSISSRGLPSVKPAMLNPDDGADIAQSLSELRKTVLRRCADTGDAIVIITSAITDLKQFIRYRA